MKLRDLLSPKLLSGIAVVGVVATAIFSAAEGMESEDVVKKAKESFPKDKERTFLAISAHVIPRVAMAFKKTIVIGGVTIVCVVASSYLSGIQIAALTGSLAYAVNQRDAIEKEVSKIPGGKEAIKKAKDEVAKLKAEKAVKDEPKAKVPWRNQTIEETGNGDDLFLDEWSGRLFLSSEEAVRKGFDKFNAERDEGMDLPYDNNRDMNMPPASSYNELYEAWDLVPSGLGWTFGWPASDDYYEHRSIPYTIEVIPVEEMNDKELKKYGKDLHIIRIPAGFYPMECYLEV